MTSVEALDKIKTELARYDYTAVASPCEITIRTKKQQVAGWIKFDGPDPLVVNRYEGARNMMGSVAQRGIEAALKAEVL